jgi:hypothetical protein
MVTYADVDWAGSIDDQRSTNRATFFLGDLWNSHDEDALLLVLKMISIWLV